MLWRKADETKENLNVEEKERKKAEQSENAFTTSVSDLMAGLLSIFILALCLFYAEFPSSDKQVYWKYRTSGASYCKM